MGVYVKKQTNVENVVYLVNVDQMGIAYVKKVFEASVAHKGQIVIWIAKMVGHLNKKFRAFHPMIAQIQNATAMPIMKGTIVKLAAYSVPMMGTLMLPVRHVYVHDGSLDQESLPPTNYVEKNIRKFHSSLI